MSGGRPTVRRVGRRRVVTDEPAGLEALVDATPSDADPDASDSGQVEDRLPQDGRVDTDRADDGSDRDAWLRDQVPPHWS